MSTVSSSAPFSSFKQRLQRTLLLGYEPTPELIAILLVYFVQGIVGLAQLAISFFLKDVLLLSPTETAAFVGIAFLPWSVKPLYGFISDGLPILGYRRRPYLVLAGLLGACGWLGLGTVIHTPGVAIAAMALSNLSIALADVIVDSLVVERARRESVEGIGSLQSLCWGTMAVGGLLTAYLSGFLLDYIGIRSVFLVTAGFPLIVSFSAWFIPETKVTKSISFQGLKQQLGLLRKVITRNVIWMPTLFIFLLRSTPGSDTAYFYFVTNDLGFSAEFLGRVQLVSRIAALMGIWMFYRFFKGVAFRKIFGWTIVISTVLGLTTLLLVTHTNRALGIPDRWFSLGDSMILTIAGEIAFLPILVLAARICPPGVEATLFALLMSVNNGSYFVSNELGAVLTHWFGVTETNFTHLWQLVLVTNFSTLFPLPFLGLLPDASVQKMQPTQEHTLEMDNTVMQTIEKIQQPLSYNPEDWCRGYQSQPLESEYWIEEIEGQIPLELNGTLYRNGPGLLDVKGTPVHHPFDGDGMICRVAIAEGRAHFRNRIIRTKGYQEEQQAGKILYRGVFGTQKPGGWFANCFDIQFKNVANTNVVSLGNKLLALWEGADPYRLDPVTLETLGTDDMGGVLKPGEPFAAHPRIDPGSPFTGGEPRFVNFSVKSGLSTSLDIYEFDLTGKLVQKQSHIIPGFAFLHDFALTPNYYIFFQNPVRYNPLPFVLGFQGAGQCLQFRDDRPTNAMLIPRDPSAQKHQIETDPCFVFHHANAFEQDGKVLIDSICYDFFPVVDPDTSYLQIDFDQYPPGQLWRYELDLQTQTGKRRCLESRTCEFTALHPDKVGQNARYVYVGATHEPTGNAPLQALLKLDLVSGDRKLHSFAPRGFAGEPVFVPHPNGSEEDAGWVLMVIYNAARHASDLVIFNAQTLVPEATVRLKQHIPYGLHGSFVPHP